MVTVWVIKGSGTLDLAACIQVSQGGGLQIVGRCNLPLVVPGSAAAVAAAAAGVAAVAAAPTAAAAGLATNRPHSVARAAPAGRYAVLRAAGWWLRCCL